MKMSDEISRTLIKKKVVSTRQMMISIPSALLPVHNLFFVTRISFSSHFLDSCKLKINKFELKTGRFFIKLCHPSLHRFFNLLF